MKILQIGKFYPIEGGVDKVMIDLTKGLSERGVACDMLCAANGVPQTVRLNDYGRVIATKTIVQLAATMISPAMIWKLRRIASDYDVIHIHHPDPMACLALFCSGYKGKVILHWHSDILKQKILLQFYKPLQNWLKKRADKIVGTTPVYVAQSKALADCQDKVGYIPIGVQDVSLDRSQPHAIRRQYAGKKIVYTLGRLVGYKGYKYLVDAAKYLTDDYVILIGGRGPLMEELQKQIEVSGVEDKVKLLGYIRNEDFASYYQACDVFCLSSIWKTEAFAIVQVEAMSCGKPVVATEIPESGVPWVNKHAYSGLNVPIEDGRALADAILKITSDEGVYQGYSERSRKHYEDNFTYDKMIDRCLSLYKEVLGK